MNIKKTIATVLVGCSLFSVGMPAFAAESELVQTVITAPAAENTVHYLTDTVTRGENYPTTVWDLTAQDYIGQFDFGSTIFTNTCFSVKPSGRLHITMDATNTLGVSNGKIKITCYEKTLFGATEVASINSSTSKYPSANYTFTGLDTSKKYFIGFQANPMDSSRYHYIGSFQISN